METIHELPTSQLTVMKIIWDMGEPVQLADVYAAAKERYGKEWKYQTVSTYIGWLVKRGFLSMKQSGRAYDYSPLISEEEYLALTMKNLTRFWGKKSLKPMICALREEEELTEKDIREIEEMLNESVE